MIRLLSAYLRLTEASVYACLIFAADAVKNEAVFSVAA